MRLCPALTSDRPPRQIELHFKPASTFGFQSLRVTCAAPTHPGGLQSFLPGGSSSRLFRGTIPMAACMIVMNFLNFIFQIALRTQKASHWAPRAGCRCASADHAPKERPVREADSKSKHLPSPCRHQDAAKLATAEKSSSFRGHKARESEVPRCSGYYEPLLTSALSLTDVLLALASEGGEEDKRKTSSHVSARRWAGRVGMTARHSYIILELLWTLH